MIAFRIEEEKYEILSQAVDNVSEFIRGLIDSAMLDGLRSGLKHKKALVAQNVIRKKEETLDAEKELASINEALAKMEKLKEKSDEARNRELDIFLTRLRAFRQTNELEEAIKKARMALGTRVDVDILMETGFDSQKELLDWLQENAERNAK